MSMRRLGSIASAVVAVILIFAPQFGPQIHLDVSIISEVLLFAVAAMSVNLLLGYTGLPAFGNAAFFGLGSYGAGLSIHYFGSGFCLRGSPESWQPGCSDSARRAGTLC